MSITTTTTPGTLTGENVVTVHRQRVLIRAAAVHAAQMATSPLIGRHGCARYVAEIAKAQGREWEWIGMWMDATPSIFSDPYVTMAERDRRERMWRDQSKALNTAAFAAFKDGRWDDARELIERAADLDPEGGAWDAALAKIDEMASAG